MDSLTRAITYFFVLLIVLTFTVKHMEMNHYTK